MACSLFFLFAFALFSLASIPFSVSQLSPTFYNKLCPLALPTIRRVVVDAVLRERRMGASLLRLHFHDCFVNGCDGSLLLDQAPGIDSEKNALPNLNTARGFEVVDRIKSEVDKVCGRPVVSCSDILAVAARDSVVALGGPTWKVQLGRKDSTTANSTKANEDLPSPFLDKPGLISAFRKQGLDAKDLVLLSAAHTVGLAQCQFFRERIYNETNIDPSFSAIRRTTCPRTGGNSNLAPFDVSTPMVFDNGYFHNLVSRRGLLHSDQVLFNGGAGGQTDELVRTYSGNPAAFSKDFGDSMIKMGNIKPPRGSARDEVRLNCRKVNSPTISLHEEDLGGNFHSQI